MAAVPIGIPGWPDFPRWTASAESMRIVLMQSWSSFVPSLTGVSRIAHGPRSVPHRVEDRAAQGREDIVHAGQVLAREPAPHRHGRDVNEILGPRPQDG